nr:hypothetical protein [uncultured Duganella sp.]
MVIGRAIDTDYSKLTIALQSAGGSAVVERISGHGTFARALKAYAAKGAGELQRDFKVEYAVTAGEEWDESDLPRLLPALAAKYLAN